MKPLIKIALAVVLFIAIAGIGVGIYLFRLPHKDLSTARPDFVITATDLQKAFEENENAATAMYVKKIVEVSGEVLSVKPGENNAVSILLRTGSEMASVNCTFPLSGEASNLKTGSVVTIRGECTGYLMDVLLKNCAIPKK